MVIINTTSKHKLTITMNKNLFTPIKLGLLAAVSLSLSLMSCSKDDFDPSNDDFVELTVADSFIGKDLSVILIGADNTAASNIAADLNNDGKIDDSEKIQKTGNFYVFPKVPKNFKIFGNFASINFGNVVTDLNITRFPKLTNIQFNGSAKVTADASNNITYYVNVDNSSSSVDMSMFTKLKTFGISNSSLTGIDLSKNTELESLDLKSNKLTALNLSANKKLSSISILLNNINQTNMQALVNSVSAPAKSINSFYAFGEKFPNQTDNNYMTKAQVAALKTKGWVVWKTTYVSANQITNSEYTGR